MAQAPREDFDLVVYLSSHAVRHLNPCKQGNLATLAVGNQTAETLLASEIAASVPEVQTSEGLASFIETCYQNATTALIVSGTQSRSYLGEKLGDLGMLVEKCEVYARYPRHIDIPAIYERSDVLLIESLNCLRIVRDSLVSVKYPKHGQKHVIVPTDRIAKVTAQNPNFIVHVSNGISLESTLHVLSELNSHVGS